MKTQFLTLILSVLLLSCLARADSAVRVHPLYLEDAYRQDMTWKTLRDQSGYLWLATDNGLRRYDGYEFKSFNHDPKNPRSLVSDTVRALHQHTDGSLWFAGNSLHRYHPDTEDFTRYTISDYKIIYTMFESNDGALWLGGDDMGLHRFDPEIGKVTHTFLGDSTGANVVSRISASRNANQIWLATDIGLLSFDLKTYATKKILCFT